MVLNLQKQIEILRKRNINLSKENEELKQKLSRYENGQTNESYLKLLDLQKEWKVEIELLKQYREQYHVLIDALKLMSNYKSEKAV